MKFKKNVLLRTQQKQKQIFYFLNQKKNFLYNTTPPAPSVSPK